MKIFTMAKNVKNTTHISIIILILLLFIIIVYMIIIFESFKRQTFIFKPYAPPTNPPSQGFYPLGKVTPLTQEQIEARNKIINSQLQAAS
jgi:hypothetical protein